MLVHSRTEIDEYLRSLQLDSMDLPKDFVPKEEYPSYAVVTNLGVIVVPVTVFNRLSPVTILEKNPMMVDFVLKRVMEELKGMTFWKRIWFAISMIFGKVEIPVNLPTQMLKTT